MIGTIVAKEKPSLVRIEWRRNQALASEWMDLITCLGSQIEINQCWTYFDHPKRNEKKNKFVPEAKLKFLRIIADMRFNLLSFAWVDSHLHAKRMSKLLFREKASWGWVIFPLNKLIRTKISTPDESYTDTQRWENSENEGFQGKNEGSFRTSNWSESTLRNHWPKDLKSSILEKKLDD